MTPTQKVIKYIATAFAIVLIASIISGILTGGFAILSALGLIHSNNSISKNLSLISSEVTDVSSLNIDLNCTNLEIKKGDTFKVETNNSKISFEEKNGDIKIKETSKNWLTSNNIKSRVVVYIPENINIEKATIKTGAGKVNIGTLNAKDFDLELGAGDVYIENVIITGDCKIDGGVGKTELKSCKINNLNANLGMGEFKFYGKLTGKSKVDSGMGAVNITLNGSKDDYKFEINKGIGNVTLDGQNVSDGTYCNGNDYLKIDGGIGETKIDFEN